MAMLKPPIARMGGKSRLRKIIIAKLPKHTCYVEPFFGAGWVYFGKEPSSVEVINDVDGDIINLFKMIKYHEPEMQRLLKYEISARDSFKKYRSEDMSRATDIQRAIGTLYMYCQSFGSQGTVYGYGTNRIPSQRIFNTKNLEEIRERLRKTYIENLSYELVIAKYDREYSVHFCDPPYLETAGYRNKFGIEDHEKLNKILKEVKGKFILTINDHPKIRDMYKEFNITKEEVFYSVGSIESRKRYSELIITNY